MRRLIARLMRYEALLFAALMVAAFIGITWVLLQQMNVQRTHDNWQTDMTIHSVPLEDIMVGGMGRDGIMPIDNPRFTHVDALPEWLTLDSPVIALELQAEARAYPLAVMIKHEIINDRIAGLPIAVTFCPLCHSPIVYDRVVNGDVLRFGVSGHLYNSGFIMWDDKTESWWAQFTGEALVGSYTGALLRIVPSQLVSLEAFAMRFPDGRVLIGDDQRPQMTYGRNPYIGYDTNPSPFMYLGEVDERLFPTQRVLSAVVAAQPIAYPFDVLAAQGVINGTVGDVPVLACWQQGARSALDNAKIAYSRDVGMAALFDRQLANGRVLTFRHDEGRIIDNETGSRWNIFGEAVAGELQGQALETLKGNTTFWFAWAAAYPDTRIYNNQ